MATELDPNQIAADLFHRVLKDASKGLTGPVRDLTTRLIDAYRKDLTRYLSTAISKCSVIKTPIINRDKPTYLFNAYVHTRLTLKNKIYLDDDFIPLLGSLKSVVIAAGAGSGKSMFMRYLFLALCEKGFGKVPLFVELRNLNGIGQRLTDVYFPFDSRSWRCNYSKAI